MKKFIATKINKQQWRVTVPNINSNIFWRSSSKEEKPESKRSSGFYDFQEAQQEFDKSLSLQNSLNLEDTFSSASTTSEEFEDARAMSDKSSKNNVESDTDGEAYQDVELTSTPKSSKNIDENNSKFHYDVPRISFKFFGEKKEENIYENEELPHEPISINSDIQIVVTTSNSENPTLFNINDISPILEDTLIDNVDKNQENYPLCHPNEKFASQTEIYVKSIESIPVAVIKSAGSDPNLTLRSQLAEDNFYQVPRPLVKNNRLSHSLQDFNEEIKENTPKLASSNDSSIDHISASQFFTNVDVESSKTTNNSVTKSKLSKLRKPAILKKHRWNSLRNKFNHLIQEQAAKQQVGAFSEKERITLNLEEMYKNSKSKCKKVFENTSKIFHKKKIFVDTNSELVHGRNLKASDIEYKFNYETNNSIKNDSTDCSNNDNSINHSELDGTDINESFTSKISSDNFVNDASFNDSKNSTENSKKEEQSIDFSAIKNAFMKIITSAEGQNGFEDLRRYVKQGGDFCKELSQILQERAEAETQYAKHLSKLSTKLSRACREGVGGLNEAWKAVALELETTAEAHRLLGVALLEETAKPLKSLTETQHRIRKQSESSVDKAAKCLSDWRTSEAKGKKHSHACARDNEKLQDAAVLDTTKYGKQTVSKSSSLIHLPQMKQHSTDKENAKLEGKKRKAENAVKKADVEYYSLCVRAERARLEWESAVLRGASTFQSLEEERLNNLKSVLTSYQHHLNDLGPKLIEASERLKGPIHSTDPAKDLLTFQNLRHSSQQVSEQLLPDFYCEHITLAMNRERRKQALVQLLQLIRQDMERERKSKIGLENLSKAIQQTPTFGSEDSQQTVIEKMYHMKSMLTYLEGAKYKVHNALSELDSRPRSSHPLAAYITITRDKSGLQQSVLKVPQWLRDEWCDKDKSPVSQKSTKSNQSDNSDPHNNDVEDPDWLVRGSADGNSNQPDSDFDEFSSQCSSSGDNICAQDDNPVHPIATCKAIYAYTPNMNDELLLKAGEIITVYRQQEDGWWLGECNGNVGIFPATYVEILRD
ncbi:uncharacterized protein LOC130450525 isoform X1 [Diorhabda sublineata]|uniref:uncharacterized protein LOC130450525 isoform X1 n=1 Tax=Diorhabda sublineata TaxID=1163346 RepID=UPI0024E12B0B|nr:uncharacterized protein LOC130450525 isoform X1 [Diorhabda sublineata]XP_056644956.1 uncharacterized protein LOC130450525 isoform X1 [Diorhabda sublineata]